VVFSFNVRSSTLTPPRKPIPPNAISITKYRRVHVICTYNPSAEEQKTRVFLRLTTETVQGAALSLESVDDVQRGDGLALGVLGVGDGVTDDTLEEGLENTTGLFIDHCCSPLVLGSDTTVDDEIIRRK
jgi:hypothetical protein